MGVRAVAYRALDCFIVTFVLLPFTVCFFRGSWDLIDSFVVIENDKPATYWMRTAIGSATVFTCMACGYVDSLFDAPSRGGGGRQTWRFRLVSRLMLYAHGFFYMFFWNGLWMAEDYHMRESWRYSIPVLSCSWLGLLLLGCTRTIGWPPLYVCPDVSDDVIKPSLRFNTKISDINKINFVSDCAVSQLIIPALAITYWRCFFSLIQPFLPETPFDADLISLIAGLVLVAFFFLIQYPLSLISLRLDRKGWRLAKVLWEDAVYLLVISAHCVLWRGAWNMNIRYVISEQKLGGLVNHLVGLVGLMATQAFSYIGAPGCTMDGSNEGGTAFFPLDYVAYFRARRKARKAPKQQQTTHRNGQEEAALSMMKEQTELRLRAARNELVLNATKL